MNIKIYTVTHKRYKFPKYNIYKPIIAGASGYNYNSFPKNYIRDDCGDNISDKHDLYSEFTVTYWVWKNSDADIIGLNHYRRYFIRGGWINYFRCLINPAARIDKYILNYNNISDIFSRGYDCIMPKKQWRVNRTLKEEFVSSNPVVLLDATEKILYDKYPAYYPVFEDVMNSRENYQKCICIMKRENFNEYAKWIFDIFDCLNSKGYDGCNREFAFLGERLINVWIEYQKKTGKIKVKENYFINVEFPINGIIKNHTEIIIPKWLQGVLRIISKLGIEIIIGNGNCKIKRRKK